MAAGKLAVKVKKDAGVTLDGDGVAVKGDGKTVTVTAAGVGIKVKANGGLESNTEGLHVKAGPGLKTDKSGLEIKLAEKGALKADNDGLAVQVAAGAGLEIDATTGLKVKLKAGKDNYIESTDAGLAITPQGIDAIKTALKSVSLEALDAAVKGTSHGYKLDSNNPAAGDVEAKIAEQLNAAYAEGWQLTQPRDALFNALKAFRETNKDKIYKEGQIAPSAVPGKSGLYAQGGLEYVAGTVSGIRVGPTGRTEDVVPWAKNNDGVYALVGTIDKTGKPDGQGGHFTGIALMVTQFGGNVTVMGHWHLTSDADWTDPQANGGWTSVPAWDHGVAESVREDVLSKEKAKYDIELSRLKEHHNDEIVNAQKEARRSAIQPVTVRLFGKPVTAALELTSDGKVGIMIKEAVSVKEIGRADLLNGACRFTIPKVDINAFGMELKNQSYCENSAYDNTPETTFKIEDNYIMSPRGPFPLSKITTYLSGGEIKVECRSSNLSGNSGSGHGHWLVTTETNAKQVLWLKFFDKRAAATFWLSLFLTS